MQQFAKISAKIILLSYLTLAAITPLIFSTYNTELFEVPKMHFVYALATIIFFATLIKQISDGKISAPYTLPILALLIFLIFQTLSTNSSVDKFTSIFGYPSRLNGGLLSQLTYFVIFAGGLINLSLTQVKKLLMTIVISALFVSLWGIPSHFGYDPSCLVLTGKLNASCWQAEFDPTVRIFSTLGQPNWLASYLVLILPISLAFALTSKKFQLKMFFSISSVIILIAIVLTNSRAGISGLFLSVVLFLLLLGAKNLKKNIRLVSILIFVILATVVIFGHFLFSRILEVVGQPETANIPHGTESSQIRLIVWKGAINTFKNKPLLGWGPETFAYSYYLHRPLAHNKTTEWNFFYNKAHNEFLNYLANIGILGTLAYISFISIITYQIIKKKDDPIAKATLAGFCGYLLTIFFGFSTVATQTISFLALAAVLTVEKQKTIEIKIKKNFQFGFILMFLILFLWAFSFPLRSFFGDILYERAKTFKSTTRAISAFEAANVIYPAKNPFILADYSFSLATQSTTSEDNGPKIAEKANNVAKETLAFAPNNLIIIRKIANGYLLISDFNDSYKTSVLDLGAKILKLAPTDPQSYLTIAKIQSTLDLKDEAKKNLKKALELKPDYLEAQDLLNQL